MARKPLRLQGVEPTLQNLKEAIAVFGCVWLGIFIFGNNNDEFKRSQSWKVPTQEPRKAGGHAVLAGGYDIEIKFITWGKEAALSKDFFSQFKISWEGVDGKPYSEDRLPIFDAYVVVWPEYLGTRSFMLGVNLKQLGKEYEKLTGKSVILPEVSYNSLYFIKSQAIGSKFIELHAATPNLRYATLKNAVSPMPQGTTSNGIWNIENQDAYFISTKATASGKVEINRLSSDTNYSKWEFLKSKSSGFSIADTANGIFTIDNGDLYFIKHTNTGNASNFVEIHKANQQSGFEYDYRGISKFSSTEAGNGVWSIRGGNLYLIKTTGIQNGLIEVHISYGDQNYQGETVKYSTGFHGNDAVNGTWDIGAKGDLYFIKTKNAESKKVEVHIATAQSKYQTILQYATAFDLGDAPNGSWCI